MQVLFLDTNCGIKRFGDPGPFHIKPMAHAKEDGMLENKQRKFRLPEYTTEDNPCPADRDHGRGKPKRSGPAIGALWRSNFRRGCHQSIKYPQLTSWAYLCGCDPWTVLPRSQQLKECQKRWLMGCALKYGHG